MARNTSIGPRSWERWIESDEHRKFLWIAKKLLRRAWKQDQKVPRSHPINTSEMLWEILKRLSKHPRKTPVTAFLPAPKPPTTLAELIPDRLLEKIWSEHHSGSFTQALQKAAGFGCRPDDESGKIFSQILSTIEIAHNVQLFGYCVLPKPKINILHRGLEEVFALVGLDDQTAAGFAGFLDDLCPCGLKRHRDAVRKLRSRKKRAS
jgi:hypothetical protein